MRLQLNWITHFCLNILRSIDKLFCWVIEGNIIIITTIRWTILWWGWRGAEETSGWEKREGPPINEWVKDPKSIGSIRELIVLPFTISQASILSINSSIEIVQELIESTEGWIFTVKDVYSHCEDSFSSTCEDVSLSAKISVWGQVVVGSETGSESQGCQIHQDVQFEEVKL
jgi:hypothetical protein